MRSTLRRVFGCRVLTAWQQMKVACVFTLLGAGLLFAWKLDHNTPQVMILDPMIERFETDYSVYRLRFAVGGVETQPCHFVAWHQSGKWSARCDL